MYSNDKLKDIGKSLSVSINLLKYIQNIMIENNMKQITFYLKDYKYYGYSLYILLREYDIENEQELDFETFSLAEIENKLIELSNVYQGSFIYNGYIYIPQT